MVEKFLKDNAEFQLEHTGSRLPVPREDAMVELYPQRWHRWVFYCLHEEKIGYGKYFGKNLAELTELVLGLGLPKFRGKQLAEWLYKRSVTDFQQMQNLPKDMRNKLAEGYVIV